MLASTQRKRVASIDHTATGCPRLKPRADNYGPLKGPNEGLNVGSGVAVLCLRRPFSGRQVVSAGIEPGVTPAGRRIDELPIIPANTVRSGTISIASL